MDIEAEVFGVGGAVIDAAVGNIHGEMGSRKLSLGEKPH